MEAMARGAAEIVKELHAQGRLDAVLALGGSGGTAIATHAMRELPVGVPKLMVSTLASGDTRPYVGAVDVTMMYSVVDIAGVNPISERILATLQRRDRRAWRRSKAPQPEARSLSSAPRCSVSRLHA